MGGLKPDVVMPGSSRIQTRQNRFQHVPSIGIRELMPTAAETVEIVFTVTIGMPENPGGRLEPISLHDPEQTQ